MAGAHKRIFFRAHGLCKKAYRMSVFGVMEGNIWWGLQRDFGVIKWAEWQV